MTVSQKAALSLLIAVVLAAGFSVLAFTGFFNLVVTRFYNPSITRSLERETEQDAGTIQNFFNELSDRFSAALATDAVKRSFLPNQAAQDIFERTRVYGLLLESQKGIQSVRFVDAGGIRIHFSTSVADILNRSAETISYRNYDETSPYVPYPEIAVPSGGNPKITLDQQNERIIFSFPFYDSMEVYRGTVFYSVSVRAVADRLIAEGRVKIGENFSVVSDPPGMVSGLPHALDEADVLIPVISSIWNEGLLNLTTLDSSMSGSALALISEKTEQGLFIGRVVDESLFAFPQSMKVILLTAIFLTIFLSIFLALNLQPDTMTIVQNRLKNLQLSLIREYYERKGEMDWNHWYRELEQRREDVRIELKRGVKGKQELVTDIDNLIDKSWDEILTAIGGKRETRLAIDEDKLQNILNRMLLAAGTSPVIPGGGPASDTMAALMPFANAGAPADSSGAGLSSEAEEVLEELGDEEEVEELGSESEIFEEDLVEHEGVSEEDALEELEELEELSDSEEPLEVDELSEPEEIAGLDEAPGTTTVTSSSIPIIVESPDLELVDNLMDEGGISGDDGELEELEELEELDEPESTGPVPLSFSDSEKDVASKIEFEVSAKSEDPAEPAAESDFEIVSPFASMRSEFDDQGSFSADDDENKKVKTSGRLEELNADYSMSLVYKPFQNEDKIEPQELPPAGGGVIKQKNGVNYVDKKAKKPDSKTSKSLDPGLKNLVDSVIWKK